MFHCQPNDPLMEIEKQWKPIVEIAPNCPRCASPNTKFCYYNNYSLSQPRYFCKGCRRYWTKGGSLRNVPVGGGCRKNRRSKSAKPRSPPANSADRSRDSSELYEISNCDSNTSKRGSDIDLAAVFANFLNHSPAGTEPVGAIGEKASEPDLAQGSAMVGNEIGESEEVGEAAFWSEASESFSWQQMAHLQDVEGFVANSPMNLGNDSVWSSFDFSGFEIFSRS